MYDFFKKKNEKGLVDSLYNHSFAAQAMFVNVCRQIIVNDVRYFNALSAVLEQAN